MALIRRCARLLWIKTRHINLNEKRKIYISNKLNPIPGYFNHVETQTRKNSDRPNIDEMPNAVYDPEALSSSSPFTAGMCYADVKRIVDKKYRDSSPAHESFGINLLKSCRDMLPDADSAARHKLIDRAWNLLENLGENFTVEHYNVLLSIYAQNARYLNADEFLRTMKATADKDTYRLLLQAIAEIGDYGQVLTIMGKIKDMGYPINEDTFNSLILAYSINADVEGARAVLDTMQAARIELNSASHCALSRCFAAKGDLGNLTQALRNGNLNAKELMSVVKTLSSFAHSEYISEVMKHLPKATGVESVDVVCTVVELTNSGKAWDALKIINCMPVPNIATDSSVGFADFFIHEMVKSDTPAKEMLEICGSLASSRKNPSALLKATEAALRLRKEHTALCAFQAMQNKGMEVRPHFYWPLLLNAASSKRETDVIRLVKHMIDNRVYLDDETLRNYTIPFLSTKDPLMIVRQLQDCGIKISQLITPLLATLLSKGSLKSAVALTDAVKGKMNGDIVMKHLLQGFIMTKNFCATASLLSNIDSGSDQNGRFLMDLMEIERVTVTNEELGSLVLAFDEKNLRISKTAAEALEPRIMRLREPQNLLEIFRGLVNPETSTTDVASWIPHPRDMSVEELEDHLADLSTKSMNTRGVLRRLVQAHCGKNNLKKAEEFARIFTEKGFEWTTGMIAGMFSLYATHNVLDEAENRYKELRDKHKGFKIDDHKIIDYATVLVNNNKLERALEVLSEQNNVRSGPDTVRNCWRFLNAVAATGNPQILRRSLSLLVDKGYCQISNHVLGPLVRTHLSNGDLPAAVAEFKECARMYRKLPLQQELLRAIVKTCTHKLDAQDQLTAVLTVIKNIHGDAAANSQLLMALAATNKQKELHTFINMPTVNQSTLNISARKLTDEKDLPALQTILKACRGVRKLDNAIIYDSILTLCSRSGDWETALTVWEKMQSEEVSPSTQFVEKLISLLKSERVAVPAELVLSRGKRKA